jgi:hypothetical protein
MPANHSKQSEKPVDQQGMGRVIRFEPRRKPQHPAGWFPSSSPRSPVEDLAKYSREREDGDDYRQRMRANIAAIVLVALLIWCGFWLFNTLADLRQVQDCILTGRTNCAPITVPAER